jgi:hypothetical protein
MSVTGTGSYTCPVAEAFDEAECDVANTKVLVFDGHLLGHLLTPFVAIHGLACVVQLFLQSITSWVSSESVDSDL